MGILTSRLFTMPPSDPLERCALQDPYHVTPGARGDHVRRIQIALNQLSQTFLAMDGIYGPKTAAAVVAFKEAQIPPLRQPGQAIADTIVGIRTIKALDAQMRALENAPTPVKPGIISLDRLGSPHNHDLCVPFLDSATYLDPKTNRFLITHHGTPINPQGAGRMLCIGGTNEVRYLGFENFVPNPDEDPDFRAYYVQGRPFTSSLPGRCASDICFRSTPIDKYMQNELKRIARPGCRLTFASNIGSMGEAMGYLMSLGPQIDTAMVQADPAADPFDAIEALHVAVFSMQNLAFS